MIPEPVSLAPLAAVMLFAIGMCGYAAYRAWRGAARAEQGSKLRTVGFAVAGTAVFIGAVAGIFLATALAGHDGSYAALVWDVLADEYGVTPVDSGAEFAPGVPFPAMVGGEAFSCTAAPPATVVCGGEMLIAQSFK